MGRIRTIKPDFFLHEGLSDLSPLHRLLFIGLWTLADKEGRLEDRPRRIKAALLPWEACDVDALLADLDAAGFIHRYQAADLDCIDIPGFVKHQRPHPKEAAFGLPHPLRREIPRPAVKRSVESRVAAGGKGREGKEILESGKEISDAPASPPLAVVAPTPLAPEPPTVSPFTEAQRGWVALYLEKTGHKYKWQGPKDSEALKRCLKAADPAEFLRRAAAGLEASGWLHIATVAQLDTKWNDLAAPAAAGPPRVVDVTRGRVAAESQDHLHKHGIEGF